MPEIAEEERLGPGAAAAVEIATIAVVINAVRAAAVSFRKCPWPVSPVRIDGACGTNRVARQRTGFHPGVPVFSLHAPSSTGR
jgi:hypothetical protein